MGELLATFMGEKIQSYDTWVSFAGLDYSHFSLCDKLLAESFKVELLAARVCRFDPPGDQRLALGIVLKVLDSLGKPGTTHQLKLLPPLLHRLEQFNFFRRQKSAVKARCLPHILNVAFPNLQD